MKIGIDLGGSHIGIGVVNENGQIVEKFETDLKNQDIGDIKEVMSKYIVSNISEITKKYNIESIGIASPGTPKKDGKIANIVNLGIKDFDITGILKEKYNLPVKIKNDAKCAALAEKKFGSLKDYTDAVFLCLGTGIGGSIFIEGKEMIPSRNPGMEIGHMVIEREGNVCNCGKKGCFETYCSIKRLKNNLIDVMKLQDNIDAKELLSILESRIEEESIQNLLDEYINNLIIGLSNIIDIFEPQAICFGGSFVYFKDILYKRLIDKYYDKKYVFNKENMPDLKLAQLGNDAGIIGATLI